MSRTPAEVFERIRAQLATTAPGLSMALGTPERKICEAAAEAISEAYIDQYLVGSLLDIDTKVGLELEQFVSIYGYGRIQGKASQGVVRITLNTAAPQDYEIPLGSQFFTKGSGQGSGGNMPLYFASTQAVVLTTGSYSVDVPVQCTQVGTIGNVGPDTITYLGSVIGSGSATNLTALTGGVDTETDMELRQRFKDTLLRNIAGTPDYYRSLALQNNRVSRVTVFGITDLYRTQIAAPSATLNLSLSQDVKYIWPGMHSVFTNLGQEDMTFYSPIYDYALSSGGSPVFTRIPTGEIETGQVVDLEFQYTTQSSRNDPVNGITNKIDIYVDGVDSTLVTEKTVVSNTLISSNAASAYYTNNFERIGSAGSPSVGNRFMRLGSVPIVTFPSTITVGPTVFTQGVHYHLLQAKTLIGGSHLEVSGIEWDPSGPDDGTELTLTYVYNRVPELLSHVMSSAKQLGSDVMVHQARFSYVRPCLSIQYDRSYSVSTTNAAIDDQLKRFFSSFEFGGQVRISTLTMHVQQVLGVVDVKLTTATDDPADYGVKIFNSSADATPASVHTADFKLADNTLPVFLGVDILRKATP